MEKILIVISICILVYDVSISRFNHAALIASVPVAGLVCYRWISSGRFPIIGLFETLLFFALCVLVLSLLFTRTADARFTLLSNAFSLVLLVPCIFVASAMSPFTPDSLKTILFPLHVAFSFIAYAFFALAFFRAITKGEEMLAGELNYFGFVAFTIGMWTGGIWAFQAWGGYVLYTVKEMFSFALWFFYAALVHLRFVKTNEKWMKWGTIVGFALMVFTYLGVGKLMANTHTL